MKTNRIFNNNIMTAIVAVLLLVGIFATMVTEIYAREEAECYEDLHIQTKQFKDDIEQQIASDREMLSLVANLAAELYQSEQEMNLVFDSYEPTGLISNVGILQPNNTFMTKKGLLDFTGRLSFVDEVKKGQYISGRVADVTNQNVEIIRIAEPIVAGGRTVGILYGAINLDMLSKRYAEAVEEIDAQLYVYESGTGNLIIDTLNPDLGNVTNLKNREYDEGYSYEELISQEKGYSVFQSRKWNEKLYLHYSTLSIADWKIMLAQRETHVFEKAGYISRIMYLSFLWAGIIIAVYFLLFLRRASKGKKITAEGSQIRKLLLDINQQQGNIREALEKIAILSKSRSAVFVDTDEEDYNYIQPQFAERLLSGEDRKYFVCEILGYAAEFRLSTQKAVSVISVKANAALQKSNPKFYEFLKTHEIKEVVFAATTDRNNRMSVLAAINPQNRFDTKKLLSDIAVCFSIAIYNKKHLNKTEIAATTDSLTGLKNRVTYKKDLEVFDRERPENFACVYIDVNELHLRNNKFGHAAGDEMLLYIANTLKEVFYGNNIYRMGGDEFLVFVTDTDSEAVKVLINQVVERLLPMDYHVAIGMAFRSQNINTEDLVTDAEKRMYDAKAQYYQNKDSKSVSATESREYQVIKTGIGEIDALLLAMKDKYNGIYRVSLKTDQAHRILMPSYLGYNETENSYSRIFSKYVEESVGPDFHRAMFSFLNYESLKKQLMEGNVPRIAYKKTNSENVMLSVYSFGEPGEDVVDTLWLFEKM